jgi:diacylglycerol kinase (ATP)
MTVAALRRRCVFGPATRITRGMTMHDAPTGESPHKGKTGLKRVWNALFYSIDGMGAAFRHEDAFRQEVFLAVLLIPAALFTPASGLGKALMIAVVVLVLIVELLNSAVEATVDRISLENHALAKRAKDIGSAAVLLALINVPVVWGLVLFG